MLCESLRFEGIAGQLGFGTGPLSLIGCAGGSQPAPGSPVVSPVLSLHLSVHSQKGHPCESVSESREATEIYTWGIPSAWAEAPGGLLGPPIQADFPPWTLEFGSGVIPPCGGRGILCAVGH